MSNQIDQQQRIAALQKQVKKLREQIERSEITPKIQAELYLHALAGEVSLIKFRLTGCMSNAAWKIVEEKLQLRELTKDV